MNKNKKKTSGYFRLLKRLAYCVRSKKVLISLLWLIILTETVALTVAPLVSRNILNSLSRVAETGVDFSYIGKMSLILVILYLIGNTFQWLDNKCAVSVSQTIILNLRNRSRKKLNRLPLKYIDAHPIGDILSILTNDTVTLSNTLDSTMTQIMAQIFTITGIIVAMLYMNVWLTVVFLIMIPVNYLAMQVLMKATKPLFSRQQKAVGILNSYMNDIYTNHTLMQAFSYEDRAEKQFTELNDAYRIDHIRRRFLSGFIIPMAKLINNLAYIALCILSGILLIKGKLDLGEFQAFLIYANMIATPVQSLSMNLNTFQQGMAAAERIFDFLDEEEEARETQKDSLDVEKVQGNVAFEHVQFGYLPEKELMKDVDFQAESGKMIAIVGESGAGKTTVINLLMRFYDIWNGTIRLDGKDIAGYTRESLRGAFGMVLQDSWIFEGTIAENIGYGKIGATREEIEQAAKIVQCDSFIDKLPEGYDTKISAESGILSSGELQLLCIARVVLADPKILILDEATSQVDTKTEALITQAMENLMKNRTSFVIAHRLFTIRNADKILFMLNGDIKEVGNHEELMKKNGLYAEMYRSISD